MRASFKASIKTFRAKFIALIVLTMFIGAIYNAADKKDAIEESKYDFSSYKPGDALVISDSLNKEIELILIDTNKTIEKTLHVVFLVETASDRKIKSLNFTYKGLNQYIRQNKLSAKLFNDSISLKQKVLQINMVDL